MSVLGNLKFGCFGCVYEDEKDTRQLHGHFHGRMEKNDVGDWRTGSDLL